ncbi:STAS domain-containing protein [Streptomyces sp. cmx-4-9]|uniref:STAS domain-containing protein n=1 Tax=Streptomyces sp. cmx-4-9 TaxID=2790941 RepID=UPI00397F2F02
MHHTLDIDVTVQPDRAVVTVAGELDTTTCPHVTAATDAIVLHGRTLILDLSGVSFMDSSALNMLLALRQRTCAEDGALELWGLHDQALRLLDLTATRSAFVLRTGLAR